MITSIEVARAVARARSDLTALVVDEYTILGVLASLAEIPLDDDVRLAASALAPVELRTLDAIHLASALALGGDLAGVLTYDNRMQQAAIANGISVLAPRPAPAKAEDHPNNDRLTSGRLISDDLGASKFPRKIEG